MRKSVLYIGVGVLVLCALFLIFSSNDSKNEVEQTSSSDTVSVNEEQVLQLVNQIEINKELETYKNNLTLYKKLIELDLENIDWYVGLANTYLELGQKSKYRRSCQEIIDAFPDEPTGYLMLIKYYDSKDNEYQVIKTYKDAPDSVKAHKEFLSIYQLHEWNYRFRDRRYENIGICSSDYFVYQHKGLYGYKKKNLIGNISAKFSIARPFIEDYAAVYKDNEWYFIDKYGYKVIASKEKIQDLYSFSEGYAVTKINDKFGYINESVKKFSFEYEDATSFFNGVAAVKKDGKWGLINKNFKPITSFIFDDVIRDDANVCSRQKVVFLKQNGVYHIFNINGQEISSTTYNDARPFYSEYAAVKKGGKWGFIDKNGNTVISFSYQNASSFSSELAAVQKNGKWGFVDKSEKTIIPFQYNYALSTSDKGVVVVKDEDVYRYIQFIKYK